MKILSGLIITIVLTAICISPVIAGTDNTQVGVGTVIGSTGVDQTIINNNEQADQDANGVVIGHGNSQVIVNDNSESVSSSSTTGGTSVSYSIINEAPEYTMHDMLDKGYTDSRILSVYSGKALIYPLNRGKEIIGGEQFNVTYKAACPLLVYVVSTNDKNKVNLISSAPIYDDVYGGFDHQNLNVVKGSVYDPSDPQSITSLDSDYASRVAEDLSPQNEILFTIPDDGKYSVVFDTRPAQHRNGLFTKVLDSTCDVAFMFGWAGYDSRYLESFHPIIGEISVFPTDQNGYAITT